MRKLEIEETLDYIYRQLGRLNVIYELPKAGISSNPLKNRSLDVKSAVMMYIAVHLSHECNRLGVGGTLRNFHCIEFREDWQDNFAR